MLTQTLQIHRTPGRLRVRNPHLKQDRARALRTQSHVAQLSGVRSVHFNSLTGSMLIHFDPSGNTSESLLQAVLSSTSVPPSLPSLRVQDSTLPLYSQATRKAAKVACVYVGEKLVEHLVCSLIAAVL